MGVSIIRSSEQRRARIVHGLDDVEGLVTLYRADRPRGGCRENRRSSAAKVSCLEVSCFFLPKCRSREAVGTTCGWVVLLQALRFP